MNRSSARSNSCKTTAVKMETRLMTMFEAKSRVHEISRLADSAFLTRDNGVVVTLDDGSRFVITIQKVK